MSTKVNIEIKPQVVIRTVLFAVLTIALLRAISEIQKPLTIVMVSFFLAVALNPPVSRISKHLPKKSRGLSVAIAYIVVISIIGGFLYLVIPPVAEQVSSFAKKIPDYAADLKNGNGPLSEFVTKYKLTDQVNKLSETASSKIGSAGSTALNGFQTILSALGTTVTILILTFLMLVEGPTIIARFWSHYNNQTKKIKHQAMASKMYHIITGYFNGQVLVAIINALMTLCAMTLFSFIFGKSIPYQFALTATVFFCSLIPMFGAMLGAAIVTIVAMFVNVKLGLCLLAYFIIYQQIENATIQPMIHGRAVSMSPLLIIIIMLCSISLGGIVAALFALPIAGCIQVILSEEMREVKANIKKNHWLSLKTDD